jgi:tetratricopeptide (TPR) repeat protein
MKNQEPTQIDNLINQMSEKYVEFTKFKELSVDDLKNKQKNLERLKEYFPLNTLQKHIERALEAIIAECSKDLPPDIWKKIEAEIVQANTNFHGEQNSLRTYKERFKFSDETIDYFDWAGVQYYFLKDFVTSASIYVFLTILDPMIERFWIRRGIAHQESNEIPEALACYAVASNLNTTNPLNNFFSAECYAKIMDMAHAREEIEIGKKIIQEQKLDKDPQVQQLIEDLQKKLAA